MKPESGRKFILPLLLAGVFAAGLFSGVAFCKVLTFHDRDALNFKLVRLYPQGGHLINPLIQVDGPTGRDPVLLKAKKNIESYLRDAGKEKEITRASVYLRDLDRGTWAGINEDDKFSIASLGKVPILFNFFIQAQRDPSVLTKELKYEKEIHIAKQQYFRPAETIELGKTYTIEELLRNMIVYSDNTSMYMLRDELNPNVTGQIYEDLRLPPPHPNENYGMSVKEYSKYFRILYSATYLNKDLSEKALEMLSQSDFHQGLEAGLPKGIKLAHKFGEKADGPEDVQLHDCGIVYYPKHPYFICVMTEGSSLDVLKEKISDISRIAYEAADSRR